MAGLARTLSKLGICSRSEAERRVRAGRVRVDGRVVLDHFLRNESDMLWSGGLWALTCTVPSKGSTYTLPLGDGWTAGLGEFDLVLQRTHGSATRAESRSVRS